jgi:hypothetical protein
MASGLALVAPRTGGVRHYADSSNAWLVEASPDAFARAVQSIRNDPSARHARQCAARATAERFDWGKVTASYFDLYDELHALTRGARQVPVLAPAFYSTEGRRVNTEGVAIEAGRQW